MIKIAYPECQILVMHTAPPLTPKKKVKTSGTKNNNCLFEDSLYSLFSFSPVSVCNLKLTENKLFPFC